ncbi:MAG: polysaccharide deacetylase family protein [Huintestinicola sp.]
MYFGSVKFFKHLILSVVFGWIGVATVLAVFFGIKCYTLEKNGAAAAEGENGIVIPEDAKMSDVIDRLSQIGYSDEEILRYLISSDRETVPADNNETEQPQNSANAADTEAEHVNDSSAVTDAPDAPAVSEETKPVQTTADTATEAPETQSTEDAVYDDILDDDCEDPAQYQTGGDYRELYPELYAKTSGGDYPVSGSGTDVYLTFQDGPSANTYDVLYILNRQNVKGTFFMSAGKTEDSRELMRAVAEAGHTIGVHSFSHDTDKIYASVESFLADFYETYKMIYDATGVQPQCYMLPQYDDGHSAAVDEIIAEMSRRGFTRCVTNAETNDRASGTSWQYIYDTSMESAASNTVKGIPSVFRFHDSADDYLSVLTLEDVIIELKAAGYTFHAVTP